MYTRMSAFLHGAAVPDKYIDPMVKLVLSWLSQGPENMVLRLKEHKHIFISMLTGEGGYKDEHLAHLRVSRSGRVMFRMPIVQSFLYDYGTRNDTCMSHVRAWQIGRAHV